MTFFTQIEPPIAILFLLGALCLIIPARLRLLIKSVALLSAIYAFVYGIISFTGPAAESTLGLFTHTAFAGVIALFVTFFCFAIVSFSLRYADSLDRLNRYFGYILWSTAFALFTVYSAHLVVLTVFWGLTGLTLYFLANLLPGAANAAKKTFIFVGGSDALMLLGIGLLWYLTGSFDIYSIRVALDNQPVLASAAFLLLAIAALTKAGAMPFHTWIPDFAEHTPMSLTAFLPAALDKLLGIFLLVLVTRQLFIMNAAMTFLLLLVGAVTVISAVYMAMIQHDMRRLLAYHAVSQVGYMVLGIASGTPLGIAGGVFHMINHAIYKSALFLSGGAVQYRTGTADLDRLGGVARFMPVTFIVCLIASLSISGVPPFNGFASKWMIYQAMIEQFTTAGSGGFMRYAYLIFLVVILFGSALTLASFMKLLHSVFLGQPTEYVQKPDIKRAEAGPFMLLPMILLALLCIIFGIFPNSTALRYFVLPGLDTFHVYLPGMPGLWQSEAAAALIVLGLLLGVIFYAVSMIKFRKDKAFIGGEESTFQARAAGTDFYRTVQDLGFFKAMFGYAEKKAFDLYEIGTRSVLGLGSGLSRVHSGNLHAYLILFLLGFVLVLIAVVH